ncbi:MAG TPA: hypothetical protein DCZ94_09795 [Lentisphaeria bacterium]|nr:MAG: hypothetical protein A2X48_19035 [Lentisphaerae bacterium GWF2_49_21]HBC87235.1 hypothetical protein [Lentisphaeria bacterium]
MLSNHKNKPFLIPDDVIANVRARIDQGWAPSIIIGVVDADGSRYFAYGNTKFKDGKPVDQHSVFEIGSITKLFTALALADMVVKEEVALDDPVQRYLPDHVHVPKSGTKEITLRLLATHFSGLPSILPNFVPRDPHAPYPYMIYDKDKLIECLNGYSLTRDPGTKFEYSNFGMRLLGIALAHHDGVPYEDMLRRRVLTPLGMTSTMVALTPEAETRLAIGSQDGHPVPNCYLGEVAGSGGLRSNAKDMTKFLSAAMGLTKTTLYPAFQLAETPIFDVMPDYCFGLAWCIRKYASGHILSHDGGTGGYRSIVIFDKVKSVGVVVLTNSTENINEIANHMIDPTTQLAPVRTVMKISSVEMKAYVGRYKLTPTITIAVTCQEDILLFQSIGDKIFPGADPEELIRLWAKAPDEFYFHRAPATVSFTRGDDRRVTALILHHDKTDKLAERQCRNS